MTTTTSKTMAVGPVSKCNKLPEWKPGAYDYDSAADEVCPTMARVQPPGEQQDVVAAAAGQRRPFGWLIEL